MKDSPFSKFIPHIIAFVTCLVISFAFFHPYIIDNKVLGQADNTRAYGMQGESTKVYKETGEYPLWTNSMFGGMPAYQIKGPDTGNLNKYVYQALLLWHGITDVPYVILMAMLCCYLFLIVMKVDWRIALAGAVGFGLSTYFSDIAEAGHSTKMVALALVPGVLSGVVLALRGRHVLGGVLFGIFLSVQILANHLQITYYMFLMIGILGIIELVDAYRHKTFPALAKSIGVLALCGLLGIMANMSRLWSTYEYSQETIRGKSELTPKPGESSDGLDPEYIWDWSYGKGESLTLLVHNFMGGGAAHSTKGTETYKRLYKSQESQMIQQGYSREQARKAANQSISSLFYWGDQPFVGTAIYAGAVLLFLFVIGIVLGEGKMKWWLTLSAFFTLAFAWGGNFFLNHLLVDYFPMFNKFRAVSMALGLTQLFIVVLAAMGLQAIVNNKITIAKKQKALYIGMGITGGFCLLAVVLSGVLDFSGPKDSRLPANIIEMVKGDRAAMMRSDALRSLMFILVAGALVFAYLKGKVKAAVLVIVISLLILIDAWTANRRIINEVKYEPKKEIQAEKEPTPSAADTQILSSEKDLHYRVMDLSRGNPFVSWDASFHHKSIGGYHAAKLMRIQEVIERYLSDFSKYPQVVDMLNVKYLIPQAQNGPPRAVPNTSALGNAWLVNSYDVVENGDAEIAALATLKPGEKAVVQKKYADALNGLTITPDPAASIKLTSYHPDKMVYDYTASSEQLAVFSEVFYGPNKGWNLYVDGQKTDGIIKADYLLRAARLPAGKHSVEMRFEPRSYYLGRTISMISSALLLLALIGGLWFAFKDKSIPDVDLLDEVEVRQAKVKTKKVKKTVSKKKKAGKKGKK